MRSALFEAAGLILLGALSRLIPHLPNMTAISAVALKARVRFGPVGVLIPIASLVISDAVLGFYNWKLLLSVYASFALVSLLGVFLKKMSARRVVCVSLVGSLLFFLITNTVVWATSAWYPHTLGGLAACLIAGLPFLYPMIVGDVLFSFALLSWFKELTSFASRYNVACACGNRTFQTQRQNATGSLRRSCVITQLDPIGDPLRGLLCPRVRNREQ